MKKQWKLTNRTIRMRMQAEQHKTRGFTIKSLAELFGISLQGANKWISLNPNNQALPEAKPCPLCGKAMADKVKKWINDGSLSYMIR